jgi:hypothetical protein
VLLQEPLVQVVVPVKLVNDGRLCHGVPLVDLVPVQTVDAPVFEWLGPHGANIVDSPPSLIPDHDLADSVSVQEFAAVIEVLQ